MSEEMLKERLRLLHEDVSRILGKLGMDEDRAYTDGGYLNVPRILNHIQETLDALSQATQFGAAMNDKYAAMNACNRALVARWREQAEFWSDKGTEYGDASATSIADCANDLETANDPR